MKSIIKGGASTLVNGVIILAVIGIICSVIYGSYWAAKHLSYSWWYEDMVKQTIRQMVNEGALRK